MSSHIRNIQGQLYEIDVVPFPVEPFAEPLPLFVATVCRRDCERRIPLAAELGGRHVYGPTEDWAVRNACDCVAARLERDADSS